MSFSRGERDGAFVFASGFGLFSRQENRGVRAGAVGLNPVGRSARALVNRHDHAAVGEATLVLVDVFVCEIPEVSTLVTLEGNGDFGWRQNGLGLRCDLDLAQWEKVCSFHWVCSVFRWQQNGGAGSVVFSDDPELGARFAVIHGQKSEGMNEPMLIGFSVF